MPVDRDRMRHRQAISWSLRWRRPQTLEVFERWRNWIAVEENATEYREHQCLRTLLLSAISKAHISLPTPEELKSDPFDRRAET